MQFLRNIYSSTIDFISHTSGYGQPVDLPPQKEEFVQTEAFDYPEPLIAEIPAEVPNEANFAPAEALEPQAPAVENLPNYVDHCYRKAFKGRYSSSTLANGMSKIDSKKPLEEKQLYCILYILVQRALGGKITQKRELDITEVSSLPLREKAKLYLGVENTFFYEQAKKRNPVINDDCVDRVRTALKNSFRNTYLEISDDERKAFKSTATEYQLRQLGLKSEETIAQEREALKNRLEALRYKGPHKILQENNESSKI